MSTLSDRQTDTSGAVMTLLVLDEPRDVEELRGLIPWASATTFDDLLDTDDEVLGALHAERTVLALLPGDAGHSLLARAQDALRRLGAVADEVRLVSWPSWQADTPFRPPGGLETPGALLAWLLSLPEVSPPPEPVTEGRDGHHVEVRHAIAASSDDDDSKPLEARSWPAPPCEAVYHGLAGEIVRAIEPHTEADPLGLLVQLHIMFGNVIGRSPYFEVESTRHHANENAVLVGQSSQGRKGTSADRIRALLSTADPEWTQERIKGGLSSGEGLISAVRDPIWQKQPIKEKGRVVDYQDVMVDGGEVDKRLLVLETEFGGVLRVLEREGNKLSAPCRPT